MIKAIIYDLDGMLFHEPHYFTAELNKKYKLPTKELQFSKDSRYNECKKGNITLTKFLNPYFNMWQKHSEFKKNLKEIKEEWFNFAKLNKPLLNLAKKLKKKGIKNIIITNNTKERINYLNKKYKLKEIFIIIGSYDLGVIKPDNKFTKVLNDKLKLKSAEVLYYDDKESTIAVLKDIGFDALVYQNLEQFRRDLEERKIKIN